MITSLLSQFTRRIRFPSEAYARYTGQTVKDGETASVVLWVRVQPEEGLGLREALD
jgi:hypothetical protein